MERQERLGSPQSKVFAEGELETIQDSKFKDFLTAFNERTTPEEEGWFDLKKALLGVSDRLQQPQINDPDERVRRQMNWLDTLKSRSFFTNSVQGTHFNTKAIVDRNNILLAISYLYTREKFHDNPNRRNVSSLEVLLKSAKEWGEHPMGEYIQALIGAPEEKRAEMIGNLRYKKQKKTVDVERKPTEENITETNVTPERRQEILSGVTINWLEEKIKVVEREIGNSPSLSFKNIPNWTELDIHPVVGEVMEYIRRENIHEKSNIPLNQASLANLREGLKVALAYINKYPYIPDAAKLEEKIIQASKKLPK